MNSVVKFDGTTGAGLGTFVAAGSGGLSGATGLTVGPDGNIYVIGFYAGAAYQYSSNGALLSSFTSPSGLSGAYRIAISPTANPVGTSMK